jgi:hypothetical protein
MFVVVPLSLVQILSIWIFKVYNDLLGSIVGWIDETHTFIVTTPKTPTVVVMELSKC